MICKNCGSEIQEGKQFCGDCGERIEIDAVEENNKEILSNMNKKSAKKGVIISIGVIFLLILAGCFIINKFTSRENEQLVSKNNKDIQEASNPKVQEKNIKTNKKEEIKKKDYTFRNTVWGMSKEEVKNNEQELLQLEEADALLYYTSIDGKDANCIYSFNDNKLYNGGYVFKILHTNKNLYIDDFDNFKKDLALKYGKPKIDKQVWLNDLYKDNPDDWGMAISAGHLRYLAGWETKDTQINLALIGDNFDINMFISYQSLNIKPKEKTKEGL